MLIALRGFMLNNSPVAHEGYALVKLNLTLQYLQFLPLACNS